jgi:asparagine synthase (glutamine-hydrolysing)
VIAVGYLQYGAKIVDRLRGMFSFAIHDRRDNILILARDRFGEKPLFYWHGPNGLVFSSELKSLLEWPGTPRKLNHEAFGYYLRFGYAPWPLTMFQDIREVPPGSVLTLRDNVANITEYYRPSYAPDPALGDLDVAVEAVGEALETAVRRQTVSDVPIGAFLSGGIDSGAVVATLQRLSDTPVQTFTVRFEDSAYDESAVARTVAEHLGTDHHEISIGDAEFTPEDLHRIVDHMGQPFFDSSAIPSYFIGRAVRPYVAF